MLDFYEILDVDRRARAHEIKSAYQRKQVENLFKDSQPPEIVRQALEQAYDVLSNPEKRKHYDFLLKHHKNLPDHNGARQNANFLEVINHPDEIKAFKAIDTSVQEGGHLKSQFPWFHPQFDAVDLSNATGGSMGSPIDHKRFWDSMGGLITAERNVKRSWEKIVAGMPKPERSLSLELMDHAVYKKVQAREFRKITAEEIQDYAKTLQEIAKLPLYRDKGPDGKASMTSVLYSCLASTLRERQDFAPILKPIAINQMTLGFGYDLMDELISRDFENKLSRKSLIGKGWRALSGAEDPEEIFSSEDMAQLYELHERASLDMNCSGYGRELTVKGTFAEMIRRLNITRPDLILSEQTLDSERYEP